MCLSNVAKEYVEDNEVWKVGKSQITQCFVNQDKEFGVIVKCVKKALEVFKSCNMIYHLGTGLQESRIMSRNNTQEATTVVHMRQDGAVLGHGQSHP